MWLQKSRLDWSLKGDKNARFFHTIALSRQCRNFLSSMIVDGECLEEPNLVKGEVLRHFKQVFTEDWGSRPQLRGQFRTIGQDQLVDGLEAVFRKKKFGLLLKAVMGIELRDRMDLTWRVSKIVGGCLSQRLCNFSRSFMTMGSWLRG